MGLSEVWDVRMVVCILYDMLGFLGDLLSLLYCGIPCFLLGCCLGAFVLCWCCYFCLYMYFLLYLLSLCMCISRVLFSKVFVGIGVKIVVKTFLCVLVLSINWC